MANDNEVKRKLKALLKERCKVLEQAQEQPPDLQTFLNENFIDNDFKSRLKRIEVAIRYPLVLLLYKSYFRETLQQAICNIFEKYIPHITNKLTGENDEYRSILSDCEAINRNCKIKRVFWKEFFIFYLVLFFIYTLFYPIQGKIVELFKLFLITLPDSRGAALEELLTNGSVQTTLIFISLTFLFSLPLFTSIYFAVEGYIKRSTQLTLSLYDTYKTFDIFFDPESKSFDREMFERYPSKFEEIENSLNKEFGIEGKKPIDFLLIRDILEFLNSLILCMCIISLVAISLILVIVFSTHEIFNPVYQLFIAVYCFGTLWKFTTAIRDLAHAFSRWKLRKKQYEIRKQLQNS